MSKLNPNLQVLVCGDFVPIGRAEELIKQGDYTAVFGDLIPEIRSADISIANLEVPLVEGGVAQPKSGPHLKGVPASAQALSSIGIDVVTLANNHIMDYGPSGLTATMEACREVQLTCVGAGNSLEEARRPHFYKRDHHTMAIINAAENEWGMTHGSEAGGNPLDPIDLYYTIREAADSADHVLVVLHGGHEGYELPSPRMVNLYRYFIDIGADAVIGHHTHCFAGSEIYKNKPIVYSLGNFVYDSTRREAESSIWNKGCAARLTFQNNDIRCTLLPFYQFRPDTAGIQRFNTEEEAAFSEFVERKTKVIQDSSELQQHFDAFARKKERVIRSYLEPVMNRWLLAAMNRGWVPRFIRGKHQRYLTNIIRCEAHRDLALRILER